MWETGNSLPASHISPPGFSWMSIYGRTGFLAPWRRASSIRVLRLCRAGLVRVRQQVRCLCREMVSSPGEILITIPTATLPTAGLVPLQTCFFVTEKTRSLQKEKKPHRRHLHEWQTVIFQCSIAFFAANFLFASASSGV